MCVPVSGYCVTQCEGLCCVSMCVCHKCPCQYFTSILHAEERVFIWHYHSETLGEVGHIHETSRIIDVDSICIFRILANIWKEKQLLNRISGTFLEF